MKEAKDLKGINNTGVYILLGVDEDIGENRAYIGEAEDIKEFEEYILTNITEDEIKNNLLKNSIDICSFYKEISSKNS